MEILVDGLARLHGQTAGAPLRQNFRRAWSACFLVSWTVRSTVILAPVATDWRWLDELLAAGLDDDFVEAALERPAVQERGLLD